MNFTGKSILKPRSFTQGLKSSILKLFIVIGREGVGVLRPRTIVIWIVDSFFFPIYADNKSRFEFENLKYNVIIKCNPNID